MAVLSTPRLELRPLTLAEASDLYDVLNHEDVGRFLLDGERVSWEWVEAEIGTSEEGFRTAGRGLWGIRERGSKELAGFVGLRPFFQPPELQLLYGLLPQYWGRGLGSEAAAAVVDHAVHDLALDPILAATDRPNEKSIRVLERLGFRRVKETDEGLWGTLYYELSADDWRLTYPRRLEERHP